jgi:hypothetical protein
MLGYEIKYLELLLFRRHLQNWWANFDQSSIKMDSSFPQLCPQERPQLILLTTCQHLQSKPFCSHEFEVNLPPSVSRPVSPGFMRPSGTRDQFFVLIEISYRQLRLCYIVAPSLTRGRVCNLMYNCFWALPEQSSTQHILFLIFIRGNMKDNRIVFSWRYLDFINVMTYDLHGSWDAITGENAPLYAGIADRTADSETLNVVSIKTVSFLGTILQLTSAYGGGHIWTRSDTNTLTMGMMRDLRSTQNRIKRENKATK